jgi:hypothetical protein
LLLALARGAPLADALGEAGRAGAHVAGAV